MKYIKKNQQKNDRNQSMSNIQSFIHGMYPRSQDLVTISRDFERKRKTLADLQAQQEKDTKAYLRLQKSLPFSSYEDGKCIWHDIFRPIAQATDGLSIGTLTRWFDNNTFFRQP